MGVMHADEVEYIFGHPLNSTLQYRQRERDLSRMMVQSVSKFASTGWVIEAGKSASFLSISKEFSEESSLRL